MKHIPIDLYGDRTGNCLRVAIALEEALLPYMLKRLDLSTGDHEQEAFLKINPLGKVPVAIDYINGDIHQPIVITQSNAILLHINIKKPGILLPEAGTSAHLVALQRFFYFVTDVIAPSHASFALRSDEATTAARRKLDERAIRAIELANRFVLEHAYLSGERFGLADIAAFTIMEKYQNVIHWHRLPALRCWFESVSIRPSVIRGMHMFD